MNGLDGKVAVVTGAGSGIGAAAARELARQGSRIMVLDLDPVGAQATADHITDTGGDAVARACNVCVAGDCRDGLAATVAAFGGVDIVVNSAGVVRYGRIDELSEQDWDLQLDTNLKSIFLMLREAVPLLRARGAGSIVNVASTQAFASQELVPAYAASKGAIVAMTRSLAIDHAKEQIRVNAVAPGSVETAMLQYAAERFAPANPEEAFREWGASHPIGRLISAEEVANVVVFLAGDAASAVTGSTYLVDGGATARLST